jgi:L-lactate dehydrogenase complex protein LldG
VEGALAMTDSRDNVLAAVARGVRVGTLPPSARLEHPGPPPALNRTADREGMIASFATELGRLSGTVHRVSDEAAARQQVLSLLDERHVRRVLAWDDEWLTPRDLGDVLRRHDVTLESCWLPPTVPERTLRLKALDDVVVGITGAHAALADTGSLIVVSGPGRGRIASLLPPVHIAVIRAEQLSPSLGHFLASNPHVADMGSNLVAITGPSRTGDIEGTLVLGVHGPGDLQVVLIG